MSKYKTPLGSEDSAPKKLHRSSRYRLPFNKQQQETPRQLITSSFLPSNQKLISNDDIKLPKLNASYELNKQFLSRRRKNNLGIHEQINISLRSQKQEMSQHQSSVRPTEHKTVLNLKEQSQASKSKLNQSKKSRKFHSSVSRYADEVDAKTQEKQSSQDQSNDSKTNLPQILEIQQSNKKQNGKNGKNNYFKAWEIFQKDITEQLQERQHKKYFKDLIKKKRRLSKQTPKKQKSLSPIVYIQKTLKQKKPQTTKMKNSKSFVDNYQFGQSQQTPNNRIRMKQLLQRQQNKLNPLQKITNIVSIKCDKKGLSGMKLPLQFYLNAYEKIKNINPFFRKLQQLQACVLLSIGRLCIAQSGKNIYRQGDPAKSIFIIIYGKILLTNKFKTLKKFSLSGQTLGEQQLFLNPKNYIERLKQSDRQSSHQQTSRALIKSCLLKISLNKYYRICRELNRLGYKQQFNLIDNLLRINFINKQNNLHRNQLDRIHTDLSGEPDINSMIY